MSEKQGTDGQFWAQFIRDVASEDGVRAVIRAVDKTTSSGQSNKADVIVACTHILGQCIALSGPKIAADIRLGVMASIDGYSMQVALGD